MPKTFDLNIEQILENWQVYHAIREIIANALDEKTITNTKDIKIEKVDNTWYIRDYGRGIQYKHFTQNENPEKLQKSNLIGKFGIGLKDALATFERHKIEVLIKSKFGNIKTKKSEKHGFTDITTLHACIEESTDNKFIGTEISLKGVAEKEMNKAKSQFLAFNNEVILDQTKFGDIIQKKADSLPGDIYFNGVKVAEELKFLFSYNITSLDAKIKKSLNRERTNVGRSAYSERIKQILKASSNDNVRNYIIDDLQNLETGNGHDELSWIDIQEHAVKIMSSQENAVFFTHSEIRDHPDMVKQAQLEGKKIVLIQNSLKERISGSKDIDGNEIPDFDNFVENYLENFEYDFVDSQKLTINERKVFDKTNSILELIGGKPKNVKKILISETMQKETSVSEVLGQWISEKNEIIIKRSQLKNLESYSATLVHEVSHAKSGTLDSTRDFEQELTRVIGIITNKILG